MRIPAALDCHIKQWKFSNTHTHTQTDKIFPHLKITKVIIKNLKIIYSTPCQDKVRPTVFRE